MHRQPPPSPSVVRLTARNGTRPREGTQGAISSGTSHDGHALRQSGVTCYPVSTVGSRTGSCPWATPHGILRMKSAGLVARDPHPGAQRPPHLFPCPRAMRGAVRTARYHCCFRARPEPPAGTPDRVMAAPPCRVRRLWHPLDKLGWGGTGRAGRGDVLRIATAAPGFDSPYARLCSSISVGPAVHGWSGSGSRI